MKKRVINLLLAVSFIASFQVPSSVFADEEIGKCTDVNTITDLNYKHWAYDAVKFVTQEFCIMPPRTILEFKGNETATRYDAANVFYYSAKKLESISRKNLKVSEGETKIVMTDLNPENKVVANSMVNEYGIMQAMVGNKFMGEEGISRYEVAFELNNYLNLLGEKLGKNGLGGIDRTSNLTDLQEDHWATPSVKNMANKYQLMLGYPDDTFRGNQTLTRYELATVLRRFFDYVDRYIMPLKKVVPIPVPIPTLVPTPIPTVEPTPEPSIPPPLPTVDLKIGGNYHVANIGETGSTPYGSLYGPSAALNLWFGELKNWGIGVNGDYTMYDSSFSSLPTTPSGLGRIAYGADINWRALGRYADEPQLTLGIGYQAWQLKGVNYSYLNHGPKGKIGLEIPVWEMFGLFAEDSFTCYLGQSPNYVNNYEYTNDLFAGITVPAYTFFSVQLGYKDIRYKLVGKNLRGDIGFLANLRFRF